MRNQNQFVVLDKLETGEAVRLLTTRTLAFFRMAPPLAKTTAAALEELDEVVASLEAGRPLRRPSFARDVTAGVCRGPRKPYNQIVGVGFVEAMVEAVEMNSFNRHRPIDPAEYLYSLYELQAADPEDDRPPWYGLISCAWDGHTLIVTTKGIEALRLRGRIRLPPS